MSRIILPEQISGQQIDIIIEILKKVQFFFVLRRFRIYIPEILYDTAVNIFPFQTEVGKTESVMRKKTRKADVEGSP